MSDYQFNWIDHLNQMMNIFSQKYQKKSLSNNTQFTLANIPHSKPKTINASSSPINIQANITFTKIDINNKKITQNPVLNNMRSEPFQYGYIAINAINNQQKFILLSKEQAKKQNASIYGLWIYNKTKRQDLLWNIILEYVTNCQINKKSIFKQKTGIIFMFQDPKRHPQNIKQYLFNYPSIKFNKIQPEKQDIKSFIVKDQKNISFAQQRQEDQNSSSNYQQKMEDSSYVLPTFKEKDNSFNENQQYIKPIFAYNKSQNKRQKQRDTMNYNQDKKQKDIKNHNQYDKDLKNDKKDHNYHKQDNRQTVIRDLDINKKQKNDNISMPSFNKSNSLQQQKKKIHIDHEYNNLPNISQKYTQKHQQYIAGKNNYQRKTSDQQMQLKLNKYQSSIQSYTQKYQSNYVKSMPKTTFKQTQKSNSIQQIPIKQLQNQVRSQPLQSNTYTQSQQTNNIQKYKKTYKEQQFKQPEKSLSSNNFQQKIQKHSNQINKQYTANQIKSNSKPFEKQKPSEVNKAQKNLLDSDSDDQQLRNIISKHKKK